MDITASSAYDLPAIQALARLQLSRPYHPGKYMLLRSIVFSVLALAIATEWYFFRYSILLYLFIFCLLIIFIGFLRYYILPKSQYRYMSSAGVQKNTLHFYDDCFTVSSTVPGQSNEATMRYDSLHKIYETDRYYFLYVNKASAYIADKQTVSPGQTAVLHDTLSTKAPKYVRCKY